MKIPLTQPHSDAAERPSRVILHGASVRAAAQSARRAHFDVFGIDLFGDVDSQAACQRFQVVGAGRGQNLPIAMRNAIHEAWRNWPGAIVIPVGSIGGDQPGKTPTLLAGVAAASGMSLPATRRADEPKRHGDPELVKPERGSGGLGVQWWTSDNDVPSTVWIQQCIRGCPHGAAYVANGLKSQLIGVCRSHHTRIDDQPFVYAGSSGPVELNRSNTDVLRRAGQAFIDATSHCGLFNVDFVVDEAGQLHLLEINPRWSASMEIVERGLQHQCKNESSLIAMHVDAVTDGKLPTLQTVVVGDWIKQVVYAESDGTFDIAACVQQHITRRSDVTEAFLADIPADGSPIRRGHPVMTFVFRQGHKD